MTKTSGQVTAVSDKGTAYGIAIGKDNWFNGKGKAPCKKGDTVDVVFEFEQDPKFGQVKAIQSVYVTGSNPIPTAKPGIAGPSDSNKYNMQMSKLKNHTNARCSAIENATKICIARNEVTNEHVLAAAKEYLKFIEDDQL